jgi:hypothetical protein
MKSLAIFFCVLAVAECTTTRPQSSHRSTRESKPVSKTILVDAKWIEVYRRMEHDRGDYKIPDDDKIVPIGDKFSVPPAVVRNFQDLSNARN